MYSIITSSKFLKDLKLLKKRSLKDFNLLHEVIGVLAERGAKGLEQKAFAS